MTDQIIGCSKNAVVVTDSYCYFKTDCICLKKALRKCRSSTTVVIWFVPNATRAKYVKKIIKRNTSAKYKRLPWGESYFRFRNDARIYIATDNFPWGTNPSLMILDDCDFFSWKQWDFINSKILGNLFWRDSETFLISAFNKESSFFFRSRARYAKFHPDEFGFFDLRTRFKNELERTII